MPTAAMRPPSACSGATRRQSSVIGTSVKSGTATQEPPSSSIVAIMNATLSATKIAVSRASNRAIERLGDVIERSIAAAFR